MKPLSLAEAAHFLRMSKSSLYQRKDIPRYRRPGSRALLFDQDELEAWVRTGRMESPPIPHVAVEPRVHTSSSSDNRVNISAVSSINTLDIQNTGVYHRNPRYR